MNRKEEIILTMLELAAEKGLANVSMSQVAEKLGIRKPSLYNHFGSKEEMIGEMYRYLREKSRSRISPADTDPGELVRGRSLAEVLTLAVGNYGTMIEQPEMMTFYRVIYSERANDPAAAAIMVEETKRMLLATKALFYALAVHGKLKTDDPDMAAFSFAMAVHAIMDHRLDCRFAGIEEPKDMMQDYINWFCRQHGGDNNE